MEQYYSPGEVMDLACRTGKLLLENGAEIYRVEQTINYICGTHQMNECESFATPTSIIVSFTDNHGRVHSRMRRITARSVDLDKISRINSLSRKLAKNELSLEQAVEALGVIEAAKPYPFSMLLLASAVGTGAFTIMFGGVFSDFICGIVIGALLRLITYGLSKIGAGAFAVNLAAGAVAALLGWAAGQLGAGTQWWVLTLSALMLMVPGLLFTNALRDIAAGDLISGISRTTEASCIAAALACGAAVMIGLFAYLGGPLL